MLLTWRNDTAFKAAIVTLVVSVLAIAGAFYFQFVLQLPPCPLCLLQRWPFYAAIPLSAIAVWLSRPAAGSITLARVLLGILALGFLIGAAMAAFHAGVEWKLWNGPASCSDTTLSITQDADVFLQRLQAVQIVRCDEAAWRFAGLSIAGWNVLLSLGLMLVAALGAWRNR